MYAAPPVSVHGTGGPAWRALRVGLPALAAGVFCAWALAHAELPPLWAAPVALAVAVLAWWRTAPVSRSLAWDGSQWLVDGHAVELQLMIDLDRWLLLRVRAADSGARWMACTAGEVGAHWPLLRAALHARLSPVPAAHV
ncbi:conserved hypothetical protein [Rubrivivax sp. A210]|uniref:hypothetical protein n=1 Tax=Rubrivivax sp. A210 TaxID=2772301 RepID=UPI001918BBE4|nr:hypothetical protein [Rubrivivax sp. A210]CAD5370661.1 conserved hypothetical protein [Rubrivivax sp. A210]